MIRSISVGNVNEALSEGLLWLRNRGDAEPSRNGSVVVSPIPVVTCYQKPCERVLFSPMRDANPFFHLMEAIWMLAGRDDVAFPAQFNKRFTEYSDDGVTAHGAYGHRWRRHFGYDQLPPIIEELQRNPASRRCVLEMWDAGNEHDELYRASYSVSKMRGNSDLAFAMGGGRDVPCNVSVFFRIVNGALDMQVNNRSNDIIWGAYGANAVHMSILHEFIALAVGVPVGRYYQASWNFHAYTDVYPLDRFATMAEDARRHDYYDTMGLKPSPLFGSDDDWDEFLEQCESFCDGLFNACDMAFFTNVAIPMFEAWHHHKAKEYPEAEAACTRIAAQDWRKASQEWIERRALKWAAKRVQSDG